MRVVSFNIHHGTVGRRGPVDPEQLGEVCRSFGADVIALQEVDRDTYRTGRADLAAAAAGACGMAHVFGASRWYPGGRYGNAILARGTITGAVATRLPKVPARRFWLEQRTALEASVTIDDRTLWVVCTHLSVPRSQNAVQLDWLLRHLGGRPGPQVVVGDLNRPLELVRREASAAGLRAVVHGPTFPVSKPRRTIDHVLVSPELEVAAAEVRPTPMSDHAALVVDLA
ncbi:endonuclease/exonuclease/phosphatase family protein [Aquihabitans daechungensis]|uniref:endonuclease/exonuclease/phosphatase family protein n=1 Tax=Aquihabitans daechungensis TaxID=1052257 RepID=UPI003B9EFD70